MTTRWDAVPSPLAAASALWGVAGPGRHTGGEPPPPPPPPRLVEAVRPMARQARLRSTQLTSTQRKAVGLTPSGFCACGLLRAVFWLVRNVSMPTGKHLRFDPTCGV